MMNRLREVFEGKRDFREMVELDDHDYDNIKVEIDVRGSKRTLDLSDEMKIRAYVDITSEVKVNDDGHPDFASIDAIAQELLISLLAEIGTGSQYVR